MHVCVYSYNRHVQLYLHTFFTCLLIHTSLPTYIYTYIDEIWVEHRKVEEKPIIHEIDTSLYFSHFATLLSNPIHSDITFIVGGGGSSDDEEIGVESGGDSEIGVGIGGGTHTSLIPTHTNTYEVKEFYAHKAILSIRSEYFYAMFKKGQTGTYIYIIYIYI